MAYVPPHRRIRDGSSSSFTPTPVAPPSFGTYNRGGRQRGIYRGYVRNNFRKWFAVDENGDPSSLLLKFKPFHGETPERLRNKKLYTLFADSAVNEGADVENNLRSSAINEASPWKRICERFKDNIRAEFVDWKRICERFKDNIRAEFVDYIEASKPDHEKPTFLIRLGKNLFRGCGLDCHEIFTMDMLEEALKAETSFQKSVMRTLDTNIQKNIVEAIEEKILADLQTTEFEEKENYFINVADNLCPGYNLRLTCVSNSEDGGQLQLKKIKMEPLIHFIADISCVNKLMDLRLTLVTENYSTELSEEERECILGIVKSACIQNGAKGGLHWPLGGNSVGNRFKVHSTWHRKVTTIVGKLCTIKLQRVNRIEFETSFGGVTYEVNLKLTNLTKNLRVSFWNRNSTFLFSREFKTDYQCRVQDQGQWDEENIMNTLEETLKWVWTECL